MTIQHLDADLWVTSHNTPNVDFAQTFTETAVQRVRSIPGVERADNLLVTFANVALPTGAREKAIVYALEDFAAWSFPWQHRRRGRRRLAPRPLHLARRLGAQALRPVRARRLPRGRGPALEDHRPDARGTLLHDDTARLHGLPARPGAVRERSPARRATSWCSSRPGPIARRCGPRSTAGSPTTTCTRRASGLTRSRGYWVVEHGLGINMGLTVFLGCLVGIVVVAQTLYTSTMEHLKEFGTVKAIGGGERATSTRSWPSRRRSPPWSASPSAPRMAYSLRPLVAECRSQAADHPRASALSSSSARWLLCLRVVHGLVPKGGLDRSRSRFQDLIWPSSKRTRSTKIYREGREHGAGPARRVAGRSRQARSSRSRGRRARGRPPCCRSWGAS